MPFALERDPRPPGPCDTPGFNTGGQQQSPLSVPSGTAIRESGGLLGQRGVARSPAPCGWAGPCTQSQSLIVVAHGGPGVWGLGAHTGPWRGQGLPTWPRPRDGKRNETPHPRAELYIARKRRRWSFPPWTRCWGGKMTKVGPHPPPSQGAQRLGQRWGLCSGADPPRALPRGSQPLPRAASGSRSPRPPGAVGCSPSSPPRRDPSEPGRGSGPDRHRPRVQVLGQSPTRGGGAGVTAQGLCTCGFQAQPVTSG